MTPFQTALQVSAFGLAGVFGFMFVFYVAIRAIQRVLPPAPPPQREE